MFLANGDRDHIPDGCSRVGGPTSLQPNRIRHRLLCRRLVPGEVGNRCPTHAAGQAARGAPGGYQLGEDGAGRGPLRFCLARSRAGDSQPPWHPGHPVHILLCPSRVADPEAPRFLCRASGRHPLPLGRHGIHMLEQSQLPPVRDKAGQRLGVPFWAPPGSDRLADRQ